MEQVVVKGGRIDELIQVSDRTVVVLHEAPRRLSVTVGRVEDSGPKFEGFSSPCATTGDFVENESSVFMIGIECLLEIRKEDFSLREIDFDADGLGVFPQEDSLIVERIDDDVNQAPGWVKVELDSGSAQIVGEESGLSPVGGTRNGLVFSQVGKSGGLWFIKKEDLSSYQGESKQPLGDVGDHDVGQFVKVFDSDVFFVLYYGPNRESIKGFFFNDALEELANFQLEDERLADLRFLKCFSSDVGFVLVGMSDAGDGGVVIRLGDLDNLVPVISPKISGLRYKNFGVSGKTLVFLDQNIFGGDLIKVDLDNFEESILYQGRVLPGIAVCGGSIMFVDDALGRNVVCSLKVVGEDS